MLPEQALIVLLITLLGVLIVNVLNQIIGNIEHIRAVKLPVEACPPHNYTYMDCASGPYLQCTKCNFKPGVD